MPPLQSAARAHAPFPPSHRHWENQFAALNHWDYSMSHCEATKEDWCGQIYFCDAGAWLFCLGLVAYMKSTSFRGIQKSQCNVCKFTSLTASVTAALALCRLIVWNTHVHQLSSLAIKCYKRTDEATGRRSVRCALQIIIVVRSST